MTLLTLVNKVQDATGLPRSSVVATSTNPLVRRVLRLANTEGKELAKRTGWDALVQEKTFLTTATEEQTDQIPADLDRWINETIFNRTRNHELIGPLTSREWQALNSITANPLTDAFRLRGGQILMKPVPAAGDTVAFEYITNQWCETAGGVGQTEWLADDDVSRLDEDLMELGLKWRVKASLGADYAEDFNTYQLQAMQAVARDGPKKTTSFADARPAFDRPHLPTAPEGDWPL